MNHRKVGLIDGLQAMPWMPWLPPGFIPCLSSLTTRLGAGVAGGGRMGCFAIADRSTADILPGRITLTLDLQQAFNNGLHALIDQICYVWTIPTDLFESSQACRSL